MDVEKYLEYINYTGSRELNLENLGRLSLLHKIAVPYSNLHLFGGEKTRLDLEYLYDKIVVKRSGGICYQLNILFAWLLRQLGYVVTTVPAKYFDPVRQDWTVDYHHMLIFVS